MMLYIVVGVVVVSVIAGIFVALKGYSQDESKAVPISDINEFRQLRKDENVVPFESIMASTPVSFKPTESKPSLTQHLLKENFSSKLQSHPSVIQPTVKKNDNTFEVNKDLSLPLMSSTPGTNVNAFANSLNSSIKDNEEVEKLRQELAQLKNKLEIEIKDSQEKISKLTKEKDELIVTLSKEIQAKESRSDLVEENLKLQEKIKKAEEIQVAMQAITQENYALTKQMDLEKSKLIESDEKYKLLNERMISLEKDYQAAHQDLLKKDQDFQMLRLDSERLEKQAEAAQIEINDLKKKLDDSVILNQTLQENLKAVSNSREIQLSQNEYTFEQFEQEKEKLVFQLKVSDLKVQELQKMVEILRQNFDLREKLNLDQKQMASGMMGDSAGEAMNKKLEWAVFNLEELKREKEKLNQVNAELELRLSKIREHNAQLMKKESMLHYELSKSRAQAIGLEKICMSLKEQLDQVNKTTSIA